MFTKLAGNRVVDIAVIIPLEERVIGIAHEQTVFAIHDTEPAKYHLFVEHHLSVALHVAHVGAFLKGPHVYFCHRKAVEGNFLFFSCFLFFLAIRPPIVCYMDAALNAKTMPKKEFAFFGKFPKMSYVA